MQLFIGAADGLEGDDFERQLYVIRKRASHQLRFDESLEQRLLFYICSLSTKVMIYKGMLNTEQVLQYFADLDNPDFATHLAMVHSRFSTNTFPSWDRAQPFRFMSHNGEINTLLGNLNWAKASEASLEEVWADAAGDLNPVVNEAFSDSANLDATLELMVRSGRSITESLITLVPEAFRNQPDLDTRPDVTAMYEFLSLIHI